MSDYALCWHEALRYRCWWALWRLTWWPYWWTEWRWGRWLYLWLIERAGWWAYEPEAREAVANGWMSEEAPHV